MIKPVNHAFSRFLCSYLCSFSQIMLQRHPVTGFIFVIGLAVGSPVVLLGATIAIFSSLLFTNVAQYDSDKINSGFYGFNAALVGMAIFSFLPVSVFTLMLVIYMGAMSAFIMHLVTHANLLKFVNLPAFTAPFIISTWLTLYLVEVLQMQTITNTSAILPNFVTSYNDFTVVMRGIGQIMFQDYWLCGLVFIVGLFIHSYKAALWGIMGSLAGLIIARYLNLSAESIHIGLYGFNASLTAIALAERYPNCSLATVFGILISVLLTQAFEQFSLVGLTAPFVLSSWLIIVFIRVNSKKALCERL